MAEQDDQVEPINLSNLRPAPGSHRNRKRIGRGPGSGTGKTAGRGHKGHKARTGGSTNPGFEGGQMPLYRRLPKRGFTNPFKVTSLAVNLRDLEAVTGSEVTPEALVAAGIIKRPGDPVKLLAQGEISRAITVHGIRASAGAIAKIEAAGGKVES